MLRLLPLCVAALCLSLVIPVRVQPQPLTCSEDAHCSDGSFCETASEICQECLSCEKLKREPLVVSSPCIKSVAECGSCYKGLVVDGRGNVNAACVPPDTSQIEGTPYYVWLLIGMGVLLFLALVIGIIAYLLRNPEIFKNAGSNPSSTVTARITATAPDAPPPYNPLPYTPVRTDSPYASPPYSEQEPTVDNEDDRPFIKRSPAPTSRPHDARESAGSQAARVYNKPIYEREPGSPSPESPLPEYNDHMTLQIHDEDTVPSTWVPSGPASNGGVYSNEVNEAAGEAGAEPSLPALLAAARDTALVEHPAAKRRCVRQDSNYNKNRESGSCGDSSQSRFSQLPSPSQGGPPYSFITQITNVVQINSTK